MRRLPEPALAAQRPSQRELDEVLALLQAGMTADALEIVEALLRRVPDDATALLYAGVAQLQAGQPDVAAPLLWQAVTSGAGPNARYYLGIALLRQDMWADGVAELETAVTAAPQNAAIHYELAYGYYRLGRLDDAAASLDRALDLRPEWSDAWERRGIVALELDDRDGAVSAWERAVAAAPDDAVRLERRLAELYLRLDRPRLALDLLEKLARESSDLQLRMSLAEAALAADEIETAIRVLDGVVEQAPEWGPGLYYRGIAARRAGALGGAADWLQRAVEGLPVDNLVPVPGTPVYHTNRQPLSLRARVQLADVLLSLSPVDPEGPDTFTRARQLLEEVVLARTYYVDAYYLLGRLLTTLDDPAAQETLRQFRRMREASEAVEVATGLLNDRPSDAAAAVQRALAADPQCPLAHYLEGKIHQRNRDWDAARTSLERAVSLDPWLAEAYPVLADVLRQLGHDEVAQRVLDEALRRGLLTADELAGLRNGGMR